MLLLIEIHPHIERRTLWRVFRGGLAFALLIALVWLVSLDEIVGEESADSHRAADSSLSRCPGELDGLVNVQTVGKDDVFWRDCFSNGLLEAKARHTGRRINSQLFIHPDRDLDEFERISRVLA